MFINEWILNPFLDLIYDTNRHIKNESIINARNTIWFGERGSRSIISRNINSKATNILGSEEGFNKAITIDMKTTVSSMYSYSHAFISGKDDTTQ